VLLCGFTAFFAIEPDDDTPFLSSCYFVSSTLSLVCNMYVVVCSSLLGALGPTYGLNGAEDTSMHDAVVLMKKERKKMLRGFELGAFFFGVCQLCATWIVADSGPSIACSVILAVGLFYICIESQRLKREFKFNEFHEEEQAVKVLRCRGSDPNYKMVKREKQLMKREKQSEGGRRMTGEKFLESPESIVKIELDPMSKTRR